MVRLGFLVFLIFITGGSAQGPPLDIKEIFDTYKKIFAQVRFTGYPSTRKWRLRNPHTEEQTPFTDDYAIRYYSRRSPRPSRREFAIQDKTKISRRKATRRQNFICNHGDVRYFCVSELLLKQHDYCSLDETKSSEYCILDTLCKSNADDQRCADCAKEVDKEKCAEINCPEEYLKFQKDPINIKDVHKTCLTWTPSCDSQKYSTFQACFDCFQTENSVAYKKGYEDVCKEVDCTLIGKDRGSDLCQKFIADCNLPAHVDEDACLQCEFKGKHEHDKRCTDRNCTRYATDRDEDVCKTWQPDCTKDIHKHEDLCLDCVGADLGYPACTAQEYDCDGVHAQLPICYYSTTSTIAPETNDDEETASKIFVSQNNDTNIYIGIKTLREDHLTDITVPTFVGITIVVGILFVLLHMPKCCFGACREPDWESYGQRKDSSSEEDDDRKTTGVPTVGAKEKG